MYSILLHPSAVLFRMTCTDDDADADADGLLSGDVCVCVHTYIDVVALAIV